MANPSNSGLEKVLHSGVNLANAGQISGNVDYHKYVDGFLKYLEATGRDPSLFPGLGQNPEALGRLAEQAVKEEKKNLTEAVSVNFEEVSKGLNPDQVFGIVYTDKSYQSLAEALSKGDVDKIRKAYLEAYKDDSLLKIYIATATEEALVKSVSKHLKKKKDQFLVENLSVVEGEGENAKAVYDPEKAAKLLKERADKLKGAEKDNLYLAIGQYFTQNALTSRNSS